MKVCFEVFPPKDETSIGLLRTGIDKLIKKQPYLISVTHGANGSNVGKQMDILRYIVSKGQDAMANVTCIDKRLSDFVNFLDDISDAGVTNVLALRGDIPKGQTGTGGCYEHADRLVHLISQEYGELNVGAACYPERHVETKSWTYEMSDVRMKVGCGARFFVSQLCYDTDKLLAYRDRVGRETLVKVPIFFGVMPVLSPDSAIKLAVSNGCSIPVELARIIAKYGDSPDDFNKAGKEFTAKQITRLMENGVDGVQIFTMNRVGDTLDIVEEAGI